MQTTKFEENVAMSNSSFDRSISQLAKDAEFLDADTERELAYAWRDQRDEKALHRLITAYMRLAISMAAKYRRYGAPMNDLIQEASVGLMKAADKFDPDRGVRFSTYAVWWIKASVQDYVMRNWSLVRTGTTAGQKSLFFNMRRVQSRIERDTADQGAPLDGQQLREQIAREVGVPLRDVEVMAGRLSGSDLSLNATQSSDDEGREWIEALDDPNAQSSVMVERSRDLATLRHWLTEAASGLSPRERLIMQERKLRDPPRTLDSLGQELGLSKERVRQIEAAAFKKMRNSLEERSEDVMALLE